MKRLGSKVMILGLMSVIGILMLGIQITSIVSYGFEDEVTKPPTIVSGRTIRNDNSFHVNVWISYDSSGGGDSFTYVFRSNLIPNQTLVVPAHGNHWSGFTIWFEEGGRSSTSIWFS